MINDFQEEIEYRKLALKKDIKKSGGNCARILLALVLSTYGLVFIMTFSIKFIGPMIGFNVVTNLKENIILGLSSDAYNFFAGYFTCIVGDLIAILIAIKTIKVKFRQEIFSKNKSNKMFALLGATSCIGVGMISSMVYMIYSTIFKILGLNIPQPDFSFPKQNTFLILFLIYVCLVGPILEEIIFRGFILRSMQKYGNLTAMIVSSILFSMFHLNLVQFINPILMGIVLAFIAIKSKSIIPSMIAHIFNNTITFATTGISLLKMPILEYAFGTLYFLVGVAALLLFISKYKSEFLEIVKEDTRILKTHQKVRYSFSGAWSRAYIVFYIIFIVVTMAATNLAK
ncbi:CPBP family intramembrane glutamic endopeptidase [Clostridium beijerinckii]|uniref:CPBP family intramembrane glutamic endopeptidase n=1 Tax=Clostridium beijerinckii TaxID=1520 RepID=UPI001F3B7CE4|nr:type II CAAX endopeptidase family protein [Clostridium beijerinckii]